jgi:hypothetical protein
VLTYREYCGHERHSRSSLALAAPSSDNKRQPCAEFKNGRNEMIEVTFLRFVYDYHEAMQILIQFET